MYGNTFPDKREKRKLFNIPDYRFLQALDILKEMDPNQWL